MIFWVCSAICLAGALVATFAGDLRVSILAFWITGLGAGGVELSLGGELMAVVQWILTTLVSISLLFHSITYGEYGVKDERPVSRRAAAAVFPVLLGASLAGVIWLGCRQLPVAQAIEPAAGKDLDALGLRLFSKHLLSLELIITMLFLALVGTGVIARPDKEAP